MATSLPKFSRAAQKILVAQNLGGRCSPPRPPGPYAYRDRSGEGGELMWATRSAPPVILCLLRACSIASPCKIVTKVRLHFRRSHISQTAAGN